MLNNASLAVAMLVALAVGYITVGGIILRCVCAAAIGPAIGPVYVHLLHPGRERMSTIRRA